MSWEEYLHVCEKLMNDDMIIYSVNFSCGVTDNNHRLLKDRSTAYLCPTKIFVIDTLILKHRRLKYIFFFTVRNIMWKHTHVQITQQVFVT